MIKRCAGSIRTVAVAGLVFMPLTAVQAWEGWSPWGRAPWGSNDIGNSGWGTSGGDESGAFDSRFRGNDYGSGRGYSDYSGYGNPESGDPPGGYTGWGNHGWSGSGWTGPGWGRVW